MHHRSVARTFLLAAGIAACGDKPVPEPHVHFMADRTPAVSIWVQDHPRLRRDLVLEGCAMWGEKGLRCELTDQIVGSDLQVHADDTHCPTDGHLANTLAKTTARGRIMVFTPCFYDLRDDLDRPVPFDPDTFRVALGHEIGHGIGVWDHVPEDCVEGATVCGEALMNPYVHPDLQAILPPDGLALDRRIDLSVRLESVPLGDDDEFVESFRTRPTK